MELDYNKISAFMAEINSIPYAYERGEYNFINALKECADDLFNLFAQLDMGEEIEAKNYYEWFLSDWEEVKRLR